MMKKLFIYSRLQIKRAIKYLPSILLITALLCICLSIALFSLVNTDNTKEERSKIKVALVGDFAESYFEFGISAIQSLDSSRFSIEILELNEDEAVSALARREIVGYVIIPEGYIIDAVSGKVERLSFVTNQNGIDMFSLFKEEVLELIACMVVESQNGVYAMDDIAVEFNLAKIDRNDHMTALSTEYVGIIFNRSNTYSTKIIGISDNLSLGGYTFAGISILLLLLCGISSCPIFIKRDMALPKLLSANRYGFFSQTVGEYSAFFLISLINSIISILIISFGVAKIPDIVPELSSATAIDLLLLPVKLIPATLAISALQFLLFYLTDSIVGGMLLQFITGIAFAYISGCLYPISFFPQPIRTLSHILPSGIARSYFSSILSGNTSFTDLCCLILFAAIFITAAAFIRARQIKTA